MQSEAQVGAVHAGEGDSSLWCLVGLQWDHTGICKEGQAALEAFFISGIKRRNKYS